MLGRNLLKDNFVLFIKYLLVYNFVVGIIIEISEYLFDYIIYFFY